MHRLKIPSAKGPQLEICSLQEKCCEVPVCFSRSSQSSGNLQEQRELFSKMVPVSQIRIPGKKLQLLTALLSL